MLSEKEKAEVNKNKPFLYNPFLFLLWATQGVRKVVPGYLRYIKDGSSRNYLRTVATGGCVNVFDTYLAIGRKH